MNRVPPLLLTPEHTPGSTSGMGVVGLMLSLIGPAVFLLILLIQPG